MTERKESKSRLGRAAASVADAIGRVTHRSKAKTDEEVLGNNIQVASEPERTPKETRAATSRPVRRESDIPLDVLEQTYTPGATNGKESFRSTGLERSRNQQFADGVADERWNDEDHYTNKSGDPRIGTHGRSYEPGESRAENDR